MSKTKLNLLVGIILAIAFLSLLPSISAVDIPPFVEKTIDIVNVTTMNDRSGVGDGTRFTMINGEGMNITGINPSTWRAISISWTDEWQSIHRLNESTSINNKSGWIILDLGSEINNLDKIYLWNVREATGQLRRVINYSIYYSTTPGDAIPSQSIDPSVTDYNFSSSGWTKLNTDDLVLPQRNATNNSPADAVVSLNGVSARYVALELLTNAGDVDRIGLADIGISQNVTSDNYTITSPGTYNLITNWTTNYTAIIINSSDVILDLNGYTLNGTNNQIVNTDRSGIRILGDNIIIKNGIFVDWDRAIITGNSIYNLTSKNNITLYNLSWIDNTYAVNLLVNNSNISNIYSSGNTYDAITLWDSNYNVINNVTGILSSGYHGLNLYGNHYSNFTNINFTGNGNSGIRFYWNNQYNRFSNGNLDVNNYGIYINDGSGDYSPNADNFNNTFENLNISTNTYGIYTRSNLDTFRNINIVSSGNTALFLSGANNNTFNDITADASSSDNIVISSSDYNTLTDISSTNSTSGNGLSLYNSNYNYLTNFYLFGNNQDNIYLDFASNNIFNNILAQNSGGNGLSIQLGSDGNYFYDTSIELSSNNGLILNGGVNNYFVNPKIYDSGSSEIYDFNWGNNYILYNNNYGSIFFTEDLDNWFVAGSSQITYPGNVIIGNNTAYVNTTALPEFNKDATLTLELAGWDINSPVITKDGSYCFAPDCVILDYNIINGTIVFNVLGFSNYSVIENPGSPNITINSPLNTTYQDQLTYILLNITTEGADNVTYNFDGTNYTYTAPVNLTIEEFRGYTIIVYAQNVFGMSQDYVIFTKGTTSELARDLINVFSTASLWIGLLAIISLIGFGIFYFTRSREDGISETGFNGDIIVKSVSIIVGALIILAIGIIIINVLVG